jgi:hypothetical protein
MTWSSKQIDSLPGGVRALPRSLRLTWVGAAVAAKGRGSSTADARKCGDAAVGLLTKGLADIGVTPDALEEWSVHNSIAHPLMQLLQEHDLGDAAGALHDLTLPPDGELSQPGDFASWLADQLQAFIDAGKSAGKGTDPGPNDEEEASDGGPGSGVGILAFTPEGQLVVVTEDGKQAAAPKGFSRLAAAAGLTAALAGAPPQAHADGNWRVDRIAFDLTDEGLDAVKRALSRRERLTKRGDQASFEAVIDQLRKDGFDDYVTPEGYLRVRVRAARSGTQQYSDGLTIWGEYRPVEEVFSPTSLASWSYKPFTNDHPPDFVGVHNWPQYAVGVVGNDASRVAGPDGDDYVEVTIVVYGFDALVAIREGKVELSAGYTANIRRETGRDHKGREYSYRQFDIYINHLSLVDRGRAGPLARIVVDGLAWQVPFAADAVGTQPEKQHGDHMSTQALTKIQVAGVEVEMTTDSAAKFQAAHEKAINDAVEKRSKEYIEQLHAAEKPKFDAFQTQLGVLEAQVGELVTAKAATDAELLGVKAENARLTSDAAARERAEVIDTVREFSPKLDLTKLPAPVVDGKAQAVPLVDIKAACVADLAPHFKDAIDTYRSQGAAAFTTFVDSLFAAEIERARKNPSSTRAEDRSPVHPTSTPRQTGDLNDMRRRALHGQAERPN